MKNLLFTCLILLCIPAMFSCNKNSDKNSGNNSADTLTAGWTIFQAPIDYDPFRDMWFNNADTGYAVNFYKVAKTINGGKTWKPLTEIMDIRHMFLTPKGKVFVGGRSLYQSADDGASFSTPTGIIENIVVEDIFFADEQYGYISGINNTNSKAFIQQTVNGGESWLPPLYVNLGIGYSCIAAAEPNGLWFLNGRGLYNINAASNTANLIPSAGINQSNYISNGALAVPSVNTIYLATDYGYLFKSVNRGADFTFIKRFDFFDGDPIYLAFITEKLGYAAFNNRIYKTEDGGINWQTAVALEGTNIWQIHANQQKQVWACTDDGRILKYKN